LSVKKDFFMKIYLSEDDFFESYFSVIYLSKDALFGSSF
jgi:hypothetical protein